MTVDSRSVIPLLVCSLLLSAVRHRRTGNRATRLIWTARGLTSWHNPATADQRSVRSEFLCLLLSTR